MQVLHNSHEWIVIQLLFSCFVGGKQQQPFKATAMHLYTSCSILLHDCMIAWLPRSTVQIEPSFSLCQRLNELSQADCSQLLHYFNKNQPHCKSHLSRRGHWFGSLSRLNNKVGILFIVACRKLGKLQHWQRCLLKHGGVTQHRETCLLAVIACLNCVHSIPSLMYSNGTVTELFVLKVANENMIWSCNHMFHFYPLLGAKNDVYIFSKWQTQQPQLGH